MVDHKAELAINNNDHHKSDPFGSRYDTWGPPRNSEGAKKAESYESYRNIDNSNWGYDDGVLLFRPLYREDEESGVHSPPLWRTATATATASPPRHQYYYNKNIISQRTNLSPTTTLRAQAIARGQRELMEMVKNMPESCYELSLKDLVEVDQHPAGDASHRVDMMISSTDQEQDEECLLGEKNYDHVDGDNDLHDQQVAADDDDDDQSSWVNIIRIESKKKKSNNTISIMKRSTSVDHNRGLFLKMVLFPIYLSSNNIKKRHVIKSSCTTSTSCARVSSKSAAQVPADRTSSKFVDKQYWWKKRSSSSINSKSTHDSTSSGRSSSSSSSSRDNNMMSKSPNSSLRKKSGLFFSSCLPCFRFNGKLAE